MSVNVMMRKKCTISGASECVCVCVKMPCAESTQGHQMSIFKYFLIWKWMNVKLEDFSMGF